MRTAFFKHALLAGLLAASLGALAPLAAPVMVAFADTAGTTAGTTAEGTATSSSGTAASGTPAASTPVSSTTAASAPAADGSTSGGAAPTSSPLGRQLATWFGPGFYGHTTACGQTMSPTLVGVASRTLPCGTLVQVGYRGRQLTLPVLDRGPYGHNGAMWDLTTGAARTLAIKDTVRITTQVVGHVQNTPTLGEPTPGDAPSGPLAAPPSTAAATGGATAG